MPTQNPNDPQAITQEEREKILRAFFPSMEPLKLQAFPPKEKKKLVILEKLAGLFEPGKEYSEKEVSQALLAVYQDVETLRRSLVDYGFMGRTRDGSKYWLM